jgi:hypothetical protein
MAAPLNKSAKKVSSMFYSGTPRGDSDSALSQSSTPSHHRGPSQDLRTARGANAPPPNLHGHRTKNSVSSHGPMPPPTSTMPLSPLVPPPSLVNYGPPRPASSHGSVRSQPSSRAASRESSRSRPSTPTTMAPSGNANSPIARVQGTPREGKISKRHSWLPKRPGQEAEGAADHEPRAWIAGLREHIPYDVSPVLRGEKVRSAIIYLLSQLIHDVGARIVERQIRHFHPSFP